MERGCSRHGASARPVNVPLARGLAGNPARHFLPGMRAALEEVVRPRTENLRVRVLRGVLRGLDEGDVEGA